MIDVIVLILSFVLLIALIYELLVNYKVILSCKWLLNSYIVSGLYILIGACIIVNQSELLLGSPKALAQDGIVVRPLSREEIAIRNSHPIPPAFTAKAIRSLSYDENQLASATGMYILSSLIANGVNGIAQEEVLSAMETENLDQANSIVRAQMKYKSPKVEIANSVWGEFLSPYQKTVKSLSTEVEDTPNKTRINAWVSKKTHGMIDKLKINLSGAKFVMINTIYFKDKWHSPFLANNTISRDFHSFDKKVDQVKMMYQSDMNIPYYEDDVLQAIKLPYQGKDVMTILLPKIPFDEFIQNFKSDYLDLPYQMRTVDDVYIPRFTIETDQSLTDQLKKWGIETIFTYEGYRYNQMVKTTIDDAELIGLIAQQTKIEVDENGTKAAAVTYADGYAIGSTLSEEPRLIFNANHPFVFIINDGLFIGTYAKGSEI